jgi:plastocyanin
MALKPTAGYSVPPTVQARKVSPNSRIAPEFRRRIRVERIKIHPAVNRHLLLLAAILSFSLIVWSCGEGQEEVPDPALNEAALVPEVGTHILIQNTAFEPSEKTVPVGTKVVWDNQDAVSHTVTSGAPGSPAGMFESGEIEPQQSYFFTFDSVGTYNYYCRYHPDVMIGTIIVEPDTTEQ